MPWPGNLNEVERLLNLAAGALPSLDLEMSRDDGLSESIVPEDVPSFSPRIRNRCACSLATESLRLQLMGPGFATYRTIS